MSEAKTTFRRSGDWLVWDFEGRSRRVRISSVGVFGEYGPENDRKVYVISGADGEEWQLPPGTKLEDLEAELIGGARPASPEDLKNLDSNMMAMHIDALEAQRDALVEAAGALLAAIDAEDEDRVLREAEPLRAQLAALRGEDRKSGEGGAA